MEFEADLGRGADQPVVMDLGGGADLFMRLNISVWANVKRFAQTSRAVTYDKMMSDLDVVMGGSAPGQPTPPAVPSNISTEIAKDVKSTKRCLYLGLLYINF